MEKEIIGFKEVLNDEPPRRDYQYNWQTDLGNVDLRNFRGTGSSAPKLKTYGEPDIDR